MGQKGAADRFLTSVVQERLAVATRDASRCYAARRRKAPSNDFTFSVSRPTGPGESRQRSGIPVRIRSGPLGAVALLVLGSFVVLACAPDAPVMFDVPITGNVPEWLVGKWYSSNGRLDIVVAGAASSGYVGALRPDSWAAQCDPAELLASENMLVIRGRCADSEQTMELRRWPVDDGHEAILNWHNYWLYRDPNFTWRSRRLAARLRRELKAFVAENL